MYFRQMKTLKTLKLLLALIITTTSYSQEKITDTIFYDYDWKICEQQNADYYRAGAMFRIDNMLYYNGPFKDYTVSNQLVADGNYLDGRKNGLFNFYYENGIVECSGKFDQDSLLAVWRWNYPDGKEHASIYFPGMEQEFKFITYRDETGSAILENGTGKFVWETISFGLNKQIVYGNFESGRRAGEWRYRFPGTKYRNDLFEYYDDEGKLTGGKVFGFKDRATLTVKTPYQFVPQQIAITEAVKHSPLFLKYGGENFPKNMIGYLENQQPFDIDLAEMEVDSVYTNIVRTLSENIIYKNSGFTVRDSKITFKVGAGGRLEDIKLTGVTQQEEKKLKYFLEKFKSIKIPADTELAPLGIFTIYINIYKIKQPVNSDNGFVLTDFERLFFSSMPLKQLQNIFEDKAKEEKYFFRGYFIRYL